MDPRESVGMAHDPDTAGIDTTTVAKMCNNRTSWKYLPMLAFERGQFSLVKPVK